MIPPTISSVDIAPAIDVQVLPERRLVGEVVGGGRLVDDCDRMGAGDVVIVEEAPAKKRYAEERPEVARA